MSKILLSSPILDFKTEDVFKAYSLLDETSYCELYDKFFNNGVAIKKQRTASLLNNCSAEGLQQLRSIDKNLYDRMNNRFNNMDFFKDFGTDYFYKLYKPDELSWKQYLGFIVENLEPNIKARFKEKIITLMLAYKYCEYKINKSTQNAINYIIGIDENIQRNVNHDYWTSNDFILIDQELTLAKIPEINFEEEAFNIQKSIGLKDNEKYFKPDMYSTINYKALCLSVIKNDYNLSRFKGEKELLNRL